MNLQRGKTGSWNTKRNTKARDQYVESRFYYHKTVKDILCIKSYVEVFLSKNSERYFLHY